RQQIEIAVALDPTNSLLRSYVGKAYYEENSSARDQLAATQFGLAKALDPNDPTPWFYDAILKQTQNRPVEALQDLQQSIARNDNRAVYRSRLALDEDAAERSVGIARIYNEVGLTRRAAVEAAYSLGVDPASYAAHRFLADAYVNLPRREISRKSELLQAQLLQPFGVQPVQPRLTIAEFDLAAVLGSPRVGPYEYSGLFDRDRLDLYANGLIGNRDTFADEVIGVARGSPASASVGQFHYQTRGFRPNNDSAHDALQALLQVAPGSVLGLQAEAVHRESRLGDTVLNFDLDSFDRTQRRQFVEDSVRLGSRVELCDRCTLLVSAAHVERNE